MSTEMKMFYNKYDKTITNKIIARIKNDLFGVYEGIVTDVSDYPNTIKVWNPVREIEETCRFSSWMMQDDEYVLIPLKTGTHVIVDHFRFNVSGPVILSQIQGKNTKFVERKNDELLIKNGNSTVSITPQGVYIDAPNIIFKGNVITQNGEDLTHDDIGAM